MSNLLHAIPAQKFEEVRDIIYDILVSEFANQYTLTNDSLFLAKITKERFTAFDKTELPAVQVVFERSERGTSDPTDGTYNHYYNIIVHTNAKYNATERGDTKATVNCQKLMGAIRYILESPANNRLNIPVPTTYIVRKKIDSMAMGEPNLHDTMQTQSGLLVFQVQCKESNEPLEASPLDQTDTIINENQLITI